MLAAHLHQPVWRKQPAFTIQLFQEVLRADERVSLAELVDSRPDPVAIGGEIAGDGFPRHHPDTLPAIGGFHAAQMAHLTREQGRLAPDRPHEQGRRIGAGRHRIEDGIPDSRLDILGLVGDEQEIGRLPAGIRLGCGGDEPRPGLPELDRRAVHRRDQRPGELVTEQPVPQAIAGQDRLWTEGRRGDDRRPTIAGALQQQKGEQLGQHLVLARLPAEHDRELVAPSPGDASQDRPRRRKLVGTEPMGRQQRRGEGIEVGHDPVERRVSLGRRARSRAHGPIIRIANSIMIAPITMKSSVFNRLLISRSSSRSDSTICRVIAS